LLNIMGFSEPKWIRDSFHNVSLPHSLADERTKGKCMGMDVSIILHEALRQQETAMQAHSRPMTPVLGIRTVLKRKAALLKKHNITPLWVLDGMRHAKKSLIDRHRAAEVAKKQKQLNDLLQAGHESDFNAVQKLRMAIGSVREDMVYVAVAFFKEFGHRFIFAPFEADWQLLECERLGMTAGTISTDSDMWGLGSKLWISMLRSNGTCLIVTQESGLAQIEEALGVTKPSQILPALVMGGCDFLPRANPLKKTDHVLSVAQYDQGGTARAAMFKKMENKLWPVGFGKTGKLIGYGKMFEEAVNLFRHAPVIREVLIGGVSTFMVLPLHPWPGFDINNMATAQKVWTELIGFDAIAKFAEVCDEPFVAYSGAIWCRTGVALRPVPKPQRDGKDMPHGSMLDFAAVPLVLVPTKALQVWLRFHGAPLTGDMCARVHAVRTATELVRSENTID
jgi:5'-3' exonuclease